MTKPSKKTIEEINFWSTINSYHLIEGHLSKEGVGVVSYALEYPLFFAQSGAGVEGQHHYGKGGLARHTLEVLELCLTNASAWRSITGKQGGINLEVLTLAAIYHDIGKVHDYAPTTVGGFKKTPHNRDIHHISRSALIFNEAASKHSLDPDTTNEVLHCILSHHITREWGSPVSPNSREAWLLCMCDGLSARLDDVDTWDTLKQKAK